MSALAKRRTAAKNRAWIERTVARRAQMEGFYLELHAEIGRKDKGCGDRADAAGAKPAARQTPDAL